MEVKYMNRDDFPMLNNNNIIYFDNGATTLKPKCVIDAVNNYYTNHTSNIHRGDYDAAIDTNKKYDEVRHLVSDFINCDPNSVIYTSGATMSLNMVVFGYMKKHLKTGDEVLLNKAEHASNILPWIHLQEEIGIVIKYVPLNDDYSLTLDNIKKMVTPKTRVISLAHISNVIGDIRDIESIGKFAHDNNILFNVDGAQSVPHIKIDFKNSNIDFLSFSSHKMCGPTGVGILVGKYELLEKMDPIFYGGGMNNFFEEDSSYELKSIPTRFEAGTPPIAEVIGLGEAIKYLKNIGMDNIHNYELKLRNYFLEKVKDIDNIIIYNKNANSGIIIFNIEGVFAQDTSLYLNHYKIAVRAGNHCSKMLKDEINIRNTVRVSFYFYNTYEEIDKLIEALKMSKDIFKVVL
ncbi:MAG: cysteine desulfurase [Bacilli bacterium]|nr:cysteine desulfurase [Bacilli bacterium]